jgi:hypothetical protein
LIYGKQATKSFIIEQKEYNIIKIREKIEKNSNPKISHTTTAHLIHHATLIRGVSDRETTV